MIFGQPLRPCMFSCVIICRFVAVSCLLLSCGNLSQSQRIDAATTIGGYDSPGFSCSYALSGSDLVSSSGMEEGTSWPGHATRVSSMSGRRYRGNHGITRWIAIRKFNICGTNVARTQITWRRSTSRLPGREPSKVLGWGKGAKRRPLAPGYAGVAGRTKHGESHYPRTKKGGRSSS
jgi:hypothetical protein